jgi:predicted RNase H-like HicB family nuclease
MQEDNLSLVKNARRLIGELTACYAGLRSDNVEELTTNLEEAIKEMTESFNALGNTEIPSDVMDEVVAFVHDLENLVTLQREVLGFYESMFSSNVQTYGPSGKVNKK